MMQPEDFTIRKAWSAFRKMTLRVDATHGEVMQAQHAFYAGFVSCFTGIAELPDQAMTPVFEKLVREIQEYETELTLRLTHGKR